MIKKKFAACICICISIAAAALFLSGGTFKETDKTLAVINGEPIFESEFNTIFIPLWEEYKQNTPVSEQTQKKENELKEIILNQKIAEIILKQETEKQKIKVSKREIEKYIGEIKKHFANEGEFKAELKKENISMPDFEKNISKQLAIRKLLKQNVEPKIHMPTEEQSKAVYNKIVAKLKNRNMKLPAKEEAVISNLAAILKKTSGEHIKIRQIFVSLPKGADAQTVKSASLKIAAIKKQLQKQTFSDVAAEYSDDPVLRQRSGDIGLVAKGDLLPVLDKVAFSLKIGEYTKEPVKTDIGYFFLKVEEKHAK
ncbi:MAG: SurA N-terminal domain-containing protein, partial [Endomicrobium sp.]|nr:SurA N-terminal domain-containing protein [Endomicrobium sp.]